MLSVDDLFKGLHFDREIIGFCVRWHLRYKLSFRDLLEMMTERGLSLAHTTIMRWVQRYVPEFEKRWNHFARQVGGSWRVDETYVKIEGRWVYFYRAVDKAGKAVDCLLRAKRDVAAAKAFFRRAFTNHGRPPCKITLDGYQASHRAARELFALPLQLLPHIAHFIDLEVLVEDAPSPCEGPRPGALWPRLSQGRVGAPRAPNRWKG